MNLKSLRYGVWYGARYVHDLRKNTVEVQVFFCGARVHQKSGQGTQNIVHQNFKFFEPWRIFYRFLWTLPNFFKTISMWKKHFLKLDSDLPEKLLLFTSMKAL